MSGKGSSDVIVTRVCTPTHICQPVFLDIAYECIQLLGYVQRRWDYPSPITALGDYMVYGAVLP